jgi:hypothetical protein
MKKAVTAVANGATRMAGRLGLALGVTTASAVLLAAALFLASPASANTFTIPAGAAAVNSGDGVCSLTEAAEAANTDAVDNECPAGTGSDTILLTGGTYVVGNLQLGDPTANQSTTVERLGASPVTIESQTLSRVMTINGGSGGVTISGVTISGGVLNVGSAIGAGIAVGGGPFTLTDSTVSGNTATGAGDSGGGIAAGTGGGQMTLINDTISGNSATGDGGGIDFGDGAGNQLTLENVTIADNHADSDGIGGGNGGGVARVAFAPAMTLHNTIIAGNSGGGAPDCVGFASGGTITRSGNLIGDPSGCAYPTPGPGDITGAVPLLGPLADNGGPTATQALLAGSPAIDHAVAPCPATDQRGVARPQLAGCDIGAFELEPAPAAGPGPPPPATGTAPPPAIAPPTGTAKPSGAFKFAKLKLNKAAGTATLTVSVPGPGRLVLSGKGIVGRTRNAAAGQVKLVVAPAGALRRRLRKAGAAKVTAKITFTPVGGAPRSKSKTVELTEGP